MSKMKKLETAVNEAYKKHFNRVQVSITKLPEIYREIELILQLSTESLQEIAFEALVEKYRIEKK